MALYTLAGTKVSIGTSLAIDFAGNNAAILGDFAADTYTPIAETETISDFGDTATDVPFTGLADARTRHLKGSTDGGVATITCGDQPDDPGQAAVKAAAAPTNQDEYNIRFEWKNGDVSYIRGPVMSFTRVNGTGPNNVAKRSFGVSNSYGEYINAAAGSGSVPDNTVLPAITGTAQEGETLTASTGTWSGTPTPSYSYQWLADGESLPGKTSSTLDVTAAMVGAAISVIVTATNTSGTGIAVSAPTSDVIAA
jgi:hypothetical protein